MRSALRYITLDPPRFSQVFESSDLRYDLSKHSSQSPPPLPPHPKHQTIIETAENIKNLQSGNNHNDSIYKRQPIAQIVQKDETENHYNIII